uniref:Uncharacterized protein n=1 Tax=Rhizophora mucronata TaxID=61149 RepID=A0A2P2NHR7_RHIMU
MGVWGDKQRYKVQILSTSDAPMQCLGVTRCQKKQSGEI